MAFDDLKAAFAIDGLYKGSKYTELFHRRTVSSFDADAIVVPDGLIATSLIVPLWPMNLNGLCCGLKFHTKRFPSSLPVIACFIFGLNKQDVMESLFPLKERFMVGSVKKDCSLIYDYILMLYLLKFIIIVLIILAFYYY